MLSVTASDLFYNWKGVHFTPFTHFTLPHPTCVLCLSYPLEHAIIPMAAGAQAVLAGVQVHHLFQCLKGRCVFVSYIPTSHQGSLMFSSETPLRLTFTFHTHPGTPALWRQSMKGFFPSCLDHC